MLHAMQSLLLTLRWGHGIEPAGRFAGFTAPVLPVIAYMPCRALSAPLRGRRLWPLAVLLVNWMAVATVPQVGDAFIPVTYPGFGGLPIGLARRGPDRLALLPRHHLRFHQA